jgi:O-antigen ligase
METPTLYALVALLVSLSVASERLVEIIKGLFPSLNQENSDPKKEGWRRAGLQALAVLAGIITALLARPAIQGMEKWDTLAGTLAIGFLASGGSGFWNAILTYVKNVKDIKKHEAEQRKQPAPPG